MTGIEQITKERLKQVAYYPDDSHYNDGDFLMIMEMLLKDDNDAERETYEDYLMEETSFNKFTLDKWNSRTKIEKLRMIGAFAAAEIDRQQNLEK